MSRLFIHGMGTMTVGGDAPFSDTWAALETLPIKDYVNPRVSRRYGRLSKMIFIAASRALENAAVDNPTAIPIVNATCMGETSAGLGLLEQIQQTRGKTISPAFVPNSVHNAPAGYLTIGLKNHAPAVTVSQGWVSSEAALTAAADFLGQGLSDRVLVLSGDEADPAWVSRLTELGAPHLAASLEKQAMQEGAVALVVGLTPGMALHGSVTAAVERRPPAADAISTLFRKCAISPGPDARVHVRAPEGADALVTATATALGRSPDRVIVDGPGPGTVQAAALNAVVRAVSDTATDELLIVAREVDDLAVTHWLRG